MKYIWTPPGTSCKYWKYVPEIITKTQCYGIVEEISGKWTAGVICGHKHMSIIDSKSPLADSKKDAQAWVEKNLPVLIMQERDRAIENLLMLCEYMPEAKQKGATLRAFIERLLSLPQKYLDRILVTRDCDTERMCMIEINNEDPYASKNDLMTSEHLLLERHENYKYYERLDGSCKVADVVELSVW